MPNTLPISLASSNYISVKFNAFCGQPSLHHLIHSLNREVDDHLCHTACCSGCAFYPAHHISSHQLHCTPLINKCMPILHCKLQPTNDHRFTERWTRFNYHYASNYKFTELDSRNVQPEPTKFLRLLHLGRPEEMERNAVIRWTWWY